MKDGQTNERFSVLLARQLLVVVVLSVIGTLLHVFSSRSPDGDTKNLLVNIAYGVFATALVALVTAIGTGYYFFHTVIFPRLTGEHSLVSQGLRQMGPDRTNIVNYKKEIEGTRNGDVVKMMGISLQSLLSVPGIETLLAEKLRSGVTFKFLIMASDSNYIAYRYLDYPFRRQFETEIIQVRTFVDKVSSVLPPVQQLQIQLRYYDLTPRFFLLSTARKLFFQFYIYGSGEFGGPCFEMVRDSSEVAKAMEMSFDHVWNESSTSHVIYGPKAVV